MPPFPNLVALRWRPIAATLGLAVGTLLVRHHLLASSPALAEFINVAAVIVLGLLVRVLVRELRERHAERRGPERRHEERRDAE